VCMDGVMICKGRDGCGVTGKSCVSGAASIRYGDLPMQHTAQRAAISKTPPPALSAATNATACGFAHDARH
jgi:hypothetical protein